MTNYDAGGPGRRQRIAQLQMIEWSIREEFAHGDAGRSFEMKAIAYTLRGVIGELIKDADRGDQRKTPHDTTIGFEEVADDALCDACGLPMWASPCLTAHMHSETIILCPYCARLFAVEVPRVYETMYRIRGGGA